MEIRVLQVVMLRCSTLLSTKLILFLFIGFVTFHLAYSVIMMGACEVQQASKILVKDLAYFAEMCSRFDLEWESRSDARLNN